MHHALRLSGRPGRKREIGHQIGIAGCRRGRLSGKPAEGIARRIRRQFVNMAQRRDRPDQRQYFVPVRVSAVTGLMDIDGAGRAGAHVGDFGNRMIAMGRRTAHEPVARCRQKRDDRLYPVGRADKDRVAPFNTAARKIGREGIDQTDKLPPRIRPEAVRHRRCIGPFGAMGDNDVVDRLRLPRAGRVVFLYGRIIGRQGRRDSHRRIRRRAMRRPEYPFPYRRPLPRRSGR